MRRRQCLDVEPSAAASRCLRFKVRHKGTTNPLTVSFRTNGDEMNLERAGVMLRKGGGSHDLGAATGEPRWQSPEIPKIGRVRLGNAEPVGERGDQRLTLTEEGGLERK